MIDINGLPIHIRVWELRTAIGWSLTDLAKHSGISRSYLASIERGDSSPTYKTILKLCVAFECQPAILTDARFDPEPDFDRLRKIKEQWK